ncbi:hypothetical protein JHK82_047902 [Glycine max]|nr:hypothetical protein JHK82_047902 [Glycine max]
MTFKKSFRFENAWLLEDKLENVVNEEWNVEVFSKLKKCANNLEQWEMLTLTHVLACDSFSLNNPNYRCCLQPLAAEDVLPTTMIAECGKRTWFGDKREEQAPIESNEFLPRLRRQKSVTSSSQYINKKELRVCVGTWNVGGKLPPDDLDIDDWLGINELADIYVLSLQEIVPLNPGNIFCVEDTRPRQKWENIIRDALNRVRSKAPKMKSFSDPPSPSKFKPSNDAPDIEEETLLESDGDIGEEVHPLDEEHNVYDGGANKPTTYEEALNTNFQASDVVDIANTKEPIGNDLKRQIYDGKRLGVASFRNIISPQFSAFACDALAVLKNSMSDPNNVLQSWNCTLVTPCTWFHVNCNSENSVTRVDLGNANLSGHLVPQLGQLLILECL